MRDYGHGGDIYGNLDVVLDYSVNINPLGMPETVRNALISRVNDFAHYPDPHCRELRAAIARHESVRKDYILCGNGAADIIYRLCRALKPRKALLCAPTFSEYERALEQVGCKATYHFLRAEDGFELTAGILDLIVPGIDIIFLCQPNNPTGLLIDTELMKQILNCARQTRTMVVVDECFLDFTCGESVKRYIQDMPELMVLKAFTKIYAMAGLRLGYLLCADLDLLDKINEVSQCWSVSVPAQIAGVAAMSCPDWIEKTRRLLTEEREYLSAGLSNLGVKVYSSDANFLLLRCGMPLYTPLLKSGILIRQCENFRGLDRSYYRVGVKTRIENMFLIQAIRESLKGRAENPRH